jgi:hypothetical protein
VEGAISQFIYPVCYSQDDLDSFKSSVTLVTLPDYIVGIPTAAVDSFMGHLAGQPLTGNAADPIKCSSTQGMYFFILNYSNVPVSITSVTAS